MSAPGEAWEGDRVARWLRQAGELERQLTPISDVLFTAARLAPGERVLDVGCGTGPTTYRAADEVGPSGAVTGVDISADMLTAAAAAPTGQQRADGRAPIEWIAADVATWEPEPAVHDAVISRFGVMFFSDPDAAFTNLAAATRTGGRLAIAVWARRDESELFEVPLRAALRVLHEHGVPEPSGIPLETGAYSLSDETATARLLGRAGWTDVVTATHDLELRVVGGADPTAAAVAARDFGATRVVLDEIDEDLLDDVTAAIADDLADHLDDRGEVVLGGRVRIVTARR